MAQTEDKKESRYHVKHRYAYVYSQLYKDWHAAALRGATGRELAELSAAHVRFCVRTSGRLIDTPRNSEEA